MHATTFAGHQPFATSINTSKSGFWISRILTTLAVLFLLVDGAMKLINPPVVQAAYAPLGLSPWLGLPLGIILLTSALLYVIPRTAFLGAILLTGYLGGAILTHVRVGNPLFSHILFPVYLGIILWTALALRDNRVRSLVASIVSK